MAKNPKGVEPYNRPAAGWGALKVTALAVRDRWAPTAMRARSSR